MGADNNPPTSSPIWTRRLDLLYLSFFVIHVPIMLAVDLTPFYPTSVKPQALVDVRNWYMETYKDPFFLAQPPPAFFTLFMVLEAVYHLPLSVWAIGALLRDDPLVPVHLLIWSVETAISTLTCTVEMRDSEGLTGQEIRTLGLLYIPYLVLALVMGSDMFLRLKRKLQGADKIKIG